ncbi:CdpA1 [Pararhodospirillum photometricum DSM 122]|uniref:CdpA1 n=1 Tax=Pararhodospirillum photometricum DSM 122 TaxID=1150469 RepID=H6SJJ7_PARPM|nr:CdpA1 [Pararhodospirillum photometricum DSM 122]
MPWSRKTVFLLGGGTAMMLALYTTAERLGVRFLYEAEGVAVDLSGAARVRVLGRVMELSPLATILCTGGYQANRAWMRESWGATAERLIVRGTPFARGTLLRSLFEQGAAQAGEPGSGHLVAVDARSPEADGGIVTRLDGLHLGIAVTPGGRRFFDEGEDLASTRYGTWGHRVAALPGQRAYVILDARGKAALLPPVFPPVEAPTLPALAGRFGIEAGTLVETVRQYNQALSEGTGVSWRRLTPPRTAPALPLTQPPFLRHSLWPRHHLHRPRPRGGRAGPGAARRWFFLPNPLCRWHEHGAGPAGQWLCLGGGPDHRGRVWSHCRTGGRKSCPPLLIPTVARLPYRAATTAAPPRRRRPGPRTPC